MTRKINLFTILIFAYSFVVCATLKKEDNKTSSFARINNTTTIKTISKVQTTLTVRNLLAFKK
jgi:hypothetical protein